LWGEQPSDDESTADYAQQNPGHDTRAAAQASPKPRRGEEEECTGEYEVDRLEPTAGPVEQEAEGVSGHVKSIPEWNLRQAHRDKERARDRTGDELQLLTGITRLDLPLNRTGHGLSSNYYFMSERESFVSSFSAATIRAWPNLCHAQRRLARGAAGRHVQSDPFARIWAVAKILLREWDTGILTEH
jgi:hypothetical protein